MTSVFIHNQSRPEIAPIHSRVCDLFASRLRGLMFTRSIHPEEGILLIHHQDSRLDASIHMLFMFYDLGIIWINSHKEVVDTTLAKKWRPIYVPSAPAYYTLETHPAQLENYKIGDKLEFQDA